MVSITSAVGAKTASPGALDESNPAKTQEHNQRAFVQEQIIAQGQRNQGQAPIPKPTPTPSSFDQGTGQINISQGKLNKTNSDRAAQDLPPLQEVQNVRVTTPTRQGSLNISQRNLERSDALRAQEGLSPLEAISNVTITSNPTHSSISQPSKMAVLVNSVKPNIEAKNKEFAQINTDFTEAKNSGVTQIQIKDSSGKVIGTVNPQNLGEARLRFLNLQKNNQGNLSYEYTKPGSTSVTSSSTSFVPKDPLQALVGGFLESGAAIGGLVVGGVAQLTGKEIAGVKSIDEYNQKLQERFGTSTFTKLTSGEKVNLQNPTEAASLIGTGAFIAATAGFGFGGLISKGASAAEKISSVISRTIKSEPKQISKTGSADIGLNVKPSESFNSAQRFERQTRTLVKPGTVSSSYREATVKSNNDLTGLIKTKEQVSLGTGIGKLISKGGNEQSMIKPPTKPSPSNPSQPKPNQGKEISVGKGLVQVVRQERVVKQENPLLQQKSKFKEYPISLGKSEGKIITKQKPQLTKAQQLTKQYQEQIQVLKSKQKYKINPLTGQAELQGLVGKEKLRSETKQKTSTVLIPLNKQLLKSGTKTTQRRKTGLVLIPKLTIKINQKTKTSTIPINKMITIQKTVLPNPLIPPSTPPPTPTPTTPETPPEEPPPSRKFPFGGAFGLNPNPGALAKLAGGGETKLFLGNVPLANIVGVYKRQEIVYGKSAERQSKTGYKKETAGFESFVVKRKERITRPNQELLTRAQPKRKTERGIIKTENRNILNQQNPRLKNFRL